MFSSFYDCVNYIYVPYVNWYTHERVFMAIYVRIKCVNMSLCITYVIVCMFM